VRYFPFLLLLAVGCAATPLTEDGWPDRPHERRLRCPDGTVLMDEHQNGPRAVTCKYPDNPMPQGFLLQWNEDRQLIQELVMDEDGYPNRQRRWYDDGKPRSEEEFVGGMIHARKVWYVNGDLQEEYVQIDGGTLITRYQADGKIESKGLVVNERRVGEWILWREGAEETVTFQDGLENGKSTRVYLDRSHEVGNWKDGKKTGAWVRQSSAGVPLSRVEWDDGLRQGTYELYHPNTQPSVQGTYLLDKREGVWVSWFSNGQKKSEGLYVCDRQHGEWKTYYADGQLESVGTYVHGQKDGEWKTFSNSGVLEGVQAHQASILDVKCD